MPLRSLSHVRPHQDVPVSSGVFFEDSHTELTQPARDAAGPNIQKRLYAPITPGHRRDIVSYRIPSGPRLGLEPRRKESSRVGMGPLIHHSSLVPSDRISASSPRVVGDARARALCAEMKRCSYYETCATYGLNVDRVFQEGELGHPLHVLGSGGLGYSSRSHLQASLCERQEMSLCGTDEGPGRSEKVCLITTGPSGQEELARPQVA